MKGNVSDRIAGAIGFAVTVLVLVSWFVAGFGRAGVGWQLGLGIPLLLVLVDYGLMMLGRDGVFAAAARLIKSRISRDS